jgi:hypothetical protein
MDKEMLEEVVPLIGNYRKIWIVRIGLLKRLKLLRSRVLPLLALGLLLLLAVWVVLAPAESRLGNVVKLVYVHGALVWAGLFTFSAAGLLGLVALVVRHLIGRPARATTWYLGTEAASLAALIVWGIYVVSAMIVTGLTWGQLVAWNEPRVRVTGLILVAAVVLFVVARLVNHADFAALVNLLLGIVPWVMVQQADVIRHPVDPIGGSGSTAIQGYYLLIQLTVAGLAAILVAWLWVRAVLRERG